MWGEFVDIKSLPPLAEACWSQDFESWEKFYLIEPRIGKGGRRSLKAQIVHWMRLCIPGQWDGALRVSGGASEATVCPHVNAPATFCFSVLWLPSAEWYIQNFLLSRLLTYYLIPNTRTACTWEALFRFKSSTKWRDFWVSGSYSDELKFHNGKWAAVIKNFIHVFLKEEISILKRSNVIKHLHINKRDRHWKSAFGTD